MHPKKTSLTPTASSTFTYNCHNLQTYYSNISFSYPFTPNTTTTTQPSLCICNFSSMGFFPFAKCISCATCAHKFGCSISILNLSYMYFFTHAKSTHTQRTNTPTQFVALQLCSITLQMNEPNPICLPRANCMITYAHLPPQLPKSKTLNKDQLHNPNIL